MLVETLPTAVNQQRSSLTLSMKSWSFCTREAMEAFLSERKAMNQAMTTRPILRSHLFTVTNARKEIWEVWELEDVLPPSTRQEELFDSFRHEDGSSKKAVHDQALTSSASVEEEAEDGSLPPFEWSLDET